MRRSWRFVEDDADFNVAKKPSAIALSQHIPVGRWVMLPAQTRFRAPVHHCLLTASTGNSSTQSMSVVVSYFFGQIPIRPMRFTVTATGDNTRPMKAW